MSFSRSLGFLRSFLSSEVFSLQNVLIKIPGERASIHTSSVLNGKARFLAQGIDLDKYTTRPLPYPKNGGRDHTGRVTNKRIGGGSRQRWRWVDYKRVGPESGKPLIERVQEIRYDPHRSADIALVASGNQRRYILATENMKVGDVIKTSAEIPKLPVKAAESDAHPVGALASGTVVHNIEYWPGEGGRAARAAGTCGTIVKKVNDMVVIRLPSKQEICVDQNCMATVGRVSNVEHNKQHMGSPNRMRWFGIRQRSGLWKKKTGIHGRKFKKPKPVMVFDVTKRNLGNKEKNSVFDLD